MRRLIPAAAGLLTAVAVFAVVWAATDGDPVPARAVGADAGRQVFARMGCGSCHTFAAAGSEGPIGPDLDTALTGYTRAALTAKIVNPGGGGFGGMPTDFGERMTGAELDALVSYLLEAES
jgi:mono/diheme cytochrome c family protein